VRGAGVAVQCAEVLRQRTGYLTYLLYRKSSQVGGMAASATLRNRVIRVGSFTVAIFIALVYVLSVSRLLVMVNTDRFADRFTVWFVKNDQAREFFDGMLAMSACSGVRVPAAPADHLPHSARACVPYLRLARGASDPVVMPYLLTELCAQDIISVWLFRPRQPGQVLSKRMSIDPEPVDSAV
jgi:hypothetical protein